jgi:hypothetical protein
LITIDNNYDCEEVDDDDDANVDFFVNCISCCEDYEDYMKDAENNDSCISLMVITMTMTR